MPLPLSGLLVVSLEQAVAAPMCTCRLADAGARVIKVERPEGDFARYYDKLAVPTSPRLRGEVARRSPKGEGVAGEGGSPSHRVLGESPSPQPSPRRRGEGAHRVRGEEVQQTGGEESRTGERAEGQSAYFVWLNRGKESLVLDLARADDKALLAAMLAKAYDMLVQAESGLASVTGGPEAPARVGVSVCDVAAGMNAYEAILAALFARERSGDGVAISISMFDAMAEWMAVPLIQYEGGAPPKRMGLAHTSIAPYGAFKTKDGADILISIQSDREWRVLADKVLGDKALAADPAFATNVERVKRRGETDARVAAVFGATDEAALTQKLLAADIAFARVNATADLAVHPQLRRIDVATPSGVVSYPAPPARSDAAPPRYGAVPALGEHTTKIWAEFLPHAPRK